MTRGTVLPRWLIIVQQSKAEVYGHLRDRFDPDGRVEVILDRRRPDPSAGLDGCWQERRTAERRGAVASDRREYSRRMPAGPIPVEVGRRCQERRTAERRGAADSDRRQHSRREPLGAKERALLAYEGFFTVPRAQRRLNAESVVS